MAVRRSAANVLILGSGFVLGPSDTLQIVVTNPDASVTTVVVAPQPESGSMSVMVAYAGQGTYAVSVFGSAQNPATDTPMAQWTGWVP